MTRNCLSTAGEDHHQVVEFAVVAVPGKIAAVVAVDSLAEKGVTLEQLHD